MKAIDKIIFNELASRRAVVLPGVGTLGVRRRTAKVDGKQVKAPVNEVVYSSKEATDVPSVIALMESMGLSGDDARVAYGEWLEGARRDDGLSIEGVGRLRGDGFVPSEELGQMLNPVRSRSAAKEVEAPIVVPVPIPVPVPVEVPVEVPVVVQASCAAAVPPQGTVMRKKRGNCLTNILLLLALALLAALAAMYIFSKGFTSCCSSNTEITDANKAYDEARKGDDQIVTTPGEFVGTVEPRPVDYHVIAGSFVYEENADRMIARYRSEYPDLNVEKVVTPAWVMVSVWQGATAEEGARASSELQQRIGGHGMWVYHKK